MLEHNLVSDKCILTARLKLFVHLTVQKSLKTQAQIHLNHKTGAQNGSTSRQSEDGYLNHTHNIFCSQASRI